MLNIKDILNKSINIIMNRDTNNNINSNMDGNIINYINNNVTSSIINNMNNNMNSSINNNMNYNMNNNMNNNNMNINNMNSNNMNSNNNSIINNNIIDESFITLSLNFNNELNERQNSINEEENLVNIFDMRNYNNNNNFVGPIKNDLLNALPENRIVDVNKLNEENNKCLICLEEYVNNDNIIFLPCFHFFHNNCIIQWIKTHANCPLCKININEIIK